MTAERHIEHSVDNGQGSAFVLVAGIEGLRGASHRVSDVNRPSRPRATVIERQCKNAMMWTGCIGDGGVEIDRLGGFVDYGSASDAKRIDIAASERGTRDGLSERTGPNQVPCGRVQGVDVVVFGRDQQPARSRPGVRQNSGCA
jgi:hypothetical protein